MDNSQSPGSIDMSQFNSQCVDPQDLHYAFDFNNQVNSPVGGNGKGRMPTVTSSLASPTSAISQELTEEQRLMLPTHDYGRYKQQTGLPSQADHFRGSVQSQGIFSGYNSGVYESQIWEGMGSQMDPNFEAYLEMSVANEDYIDPTAIMKQEEVSANIRYFPGMHQQAALQKQAMMAKQKQQREAELQQQQQRSQPTRRSASSQALDPRTEETISRVMNEIRRRSDIATDSMSSPNGSNLPHIIRAKRDEEDMDEDERLLNSEEGKKLSSKERRQLRNKVSARAFRSRRKEYIGQLEGELAAKANDASELKRQNHLLMEENARFRALAEKLLAHPAFHPFLDELSRDPDLAESLSKVTNAPSTSQTQMPKDVDAFASSQLYPPPNTTTHVGMTMIPEMPVDLSSLNIGSTGNWNSQPQHMAMFQTPQVFAVTELPTPPADTIDFEALSGKADVFSGYEDTNEEKVSMPEIETFAPVEDTSSSTVDAESVFDENDPTVTLFATSAPRSCRSTNEIEFQVSFEDVLPEKSSAHFELFVSTEEASQELSNGLSRMIARLESTNLKIDALLGC